MPLTTTKNYVTKKNWKPRSAVWELTLACNLRCDHCGSRAGRSLPDELNTAECLDLVSQLEALGCELITLSGGEPTLRDDWDIIARDIHQKGMYVNMVTNGVYGKHQSAREVATRALESGMCNVGVSIDGPKVVHDRIRGGGTFEKTTHSIKQFREVGLSTTVMTTVNRLNIAHLETVRDIAMALGANAVRYQLAKPMGTMDDHREWVIKPGEIATLLPRIAAMKQQGSIDVRVGDSLGYYGKPDKILRAYNWRRKKTRWGGCQAGMQAIGIQANGDIKGCLSMQAARGETDPFVEGNIRELSLADIWYKPGAFAYNRNFALDQLTHDCNACKQAALCRGGARCISSAVDGTVTHDDYCYYRLLSDQEQLSWATVGKSAAAAALVLSINTVGCSDDGGGPQTLDASETTDATDTYADSDTHTDTDTESAAATDTPDYAVEPETDSVSETDAPAPEYAVEPDSNSDTDNETDSDTGVDTGSDSISDTDSASDTSVDTTYGIGTDTEPDAGPEDTDTIDTDTVDTDPIDTALDYAVEPDYAVMPEYAVEPDTETDTRLKQDTDTWFEMDYAVELDYAVLPDGEKK